MSDESVRSDFSQYSTEQLRAELERRRADAAPASDPTFETRFSRRDGIFGWLEAAGRRSAVYGSGSVQLTPTHLLVRAWRRTWLGAPEQVEIEIPLADIHNVVRDGIQIRFEYKRRFTWHRQIQLTTESADHARGLTEGLPRDQSAGFEQRWAELREYNRLVKAAAVRTWVTPAVLGVNVLVFAAMALSAGALGGFQPRLYIAWGANYGGLTVTGQWWRLVTGLFLHFNLMHLVLNMWAFWNIGRLTERLYGNGLMLLLYFGAGVLASLTTVLWDPTHYSIGASGAIFGVFGAFLAYLARRETHVPVAIIRAHWLSTGIFVIFNLVSAVTEPDIDNAAHIGGLLGGLALGWILARPVEPRESREFPFRQVLAAGGLLGVAILLFRWHEGNTSLSGPEKFLARDPDFAQQEAKNLELWQGQLNRIAASRITATELADRLEHDVLPFWQQTGQRLKREAPTIPADERATAALVTEVVRLRTEWLQALIGQLRGTQPDPGASPFKLARDTEFTGARIERLVTRAALDRRPPALNNSRWVYNLRSLFTGELKWQCIDQPEWNSQAQAHDSKTDGPNMRYQAGCLAQRLLAFGDYVELDARLEKARQNLGDLPDGGSTFQGMMSGLDDLFTYGIMDFPRVLGSISDWRRAVPGSVEADLAESILYEAWAWRARGFGAADSVSPENWQLFAHRNDLAAAGLEDMKTRANRNPAWYQYSIHVGLDQDHTREELRAIFDAGIKQAPGYLPLYRAMMRSLMPRWSGSVQKLDQFIEDVTNRPGSPDRDVQLYARLYWSYDTMEQGDIKLFDDSLAVWALMKQGFAELVKRYPQSDELLNAYAKFACIGEDAATYRALRPSIENRRSSTVWGHSATLESCDQQFNRHLRPAPVSGQ